MGEARFGSILPNAFKLCPLHLPLASLLSWALSMLSFTMWCVQQGRRWVQWPLSTRQDGSRKAKRALRTAKAGLERQEKHLGWKSRGSRERAHDGRRGFRLCRRRRVRWSTPRLTAARQWFAPGFRGGREKMRNAGAGSAQRGGREEKGGEKGGETLKGEEKRQMSARETAKVRNVLRDALLHDANARKNTLQVQGVEGDRDELRAAKRNRQRSGHSTYDGGRSTPAPRRAPRALSKSRLQAPGHRKQGDTSGTGRGGGSSGRGNEIALGRDGGRDGRGCHEWHGERWERRPLVRDVSWFGC